LRVGGPEEKHADKHDVKSLAILEENCGSAGNIRNLHADKHDVKSLVVFKENCGSAGPKKSTPTNMM
jgi:hypothetical protein